MRINGKHTKHNERLTFSQIEYLRERAGTLHDALENKGYAVHYGESRMSEAIYITVEDEEISIRNHRFSNGSSEHTIWLKDFETWTDAKKHIMTHILPQLPAPGTTEAEFDAWLAKQEANKRSLGA